MDDFFDICKGGDYHKVINALKEGKCNYNGGLYGACIGGNIKIVKLLIKKGATYLNCGLLDACFGGNIKIVRLLIKKGATDYLNGGLLNACYRGHIKIIKFLIKKGAKDFNNALYHACFRGDIKIVKLLIDNGANNIHIWYSYSKNKKELYRLLRMGLNMYELKNINGYEKLIEDINKYKKDVLNNLDNYLIKDLANIVSNFSLLLNTPCA